MSSEKHDRRNNEITAREVRLVSADGEQLGVVSLEEALGKAAEAGLDLVEVAPQARPPVCKLMDYGKYLFQKNKTQQAARKKQKQIQVKEIKFRPNTEEGDYQTKLRRLVSFVEDGDKIKVTMRFRGREMAHQEIGLKLLERVKQDLDELAQVEQMPKMEGRQMVMVMAPRKS
ncbi:translation initiation factor IF-3 [Oceanococcus atlanticus]|uniref:translation initiation factor IF-3 n=1 Tax=Oceanococcus atlanticus TaxID=1317117 RepID=UPI0009FAC49F|nr:translation initiation factor IF-3 [Oceanococcus atlanticus]